MHEYSNEIEIPIFKTGVHKSATGKIFEFTHNDLSICAMTYGFSNQKSPVVLGHPERSTEIFGKVKSLRMTTHGGFLLATLEKLNNDLIQLLINGNYKNISPSFYAPNELNNPFPGTFFLQHLGFLGAAAPAVKGLPKLDTEAFRRMLRY